MWWGRGRRGSVIQAGPWPGAGPFSYLPPWQRPGWLYGRGVFNNPFPWYGRAPAPISYNPPFIQREPYYQQGASPIYPQAFSSINYSPQLTRSAQTHMNCIYFNNGICTLKGIPVSANEGACAYFTPKI